MNREAAEDLAEILEDYDNPLAEKLADDLFKALKNTGATIFSIKVTYDCV